MLIWAIWLVLWLGVYWARLIKTVWSEITKLNQTSAYCVALAAAITVIIASKFWLPVSSTPYCFRLSILNMIVERTYKKKSMKTKTIYKNEW